MHSFTTRLNTLLTFFGTVAAASCLLTASTDLFHKSSPSVKLGLGEVKKLVPYLGNRDQAVLTFNLNADLRGVFSWNTKQLFVYVQAEYWSDDSQLNQIVLWDTIIEQKEKAIIKLRNHKTKYAFLDDGMGLRGKQFNLTLVWNVMPRVGYLSYHSHAVDIGRLPSTYKS
mmetsp:Transcript_11703/g.25107  ORF Transcript_11703/g.25107 Transcript_11703/m.25107 type:complete len:170 (+) Transcript_11703:132-641(+)